MASIDDYQTQIEAVWDKHWKEHESAPTEELVLGKVLKDFSEAKDDREHQLLARAIADTLLPPPKAAATSASSSSSVAAQAKDEKTSDAKDQTPLSGIEAAINTLNRRFGDGPVQLKKDSELAKALSAFFSCYPRHANKLHKNILDNLTLKNERAMLARFIKLEELIKQVSELPDFNPDVETYAGEGHEKFSSQLHLIARLASPLEIDDLVRKILISYDEPGDQQKKYRNLTILAVCAGKTTVEQQQKAVIVFIDCLTKKGTWETENQQWTLVTAARGLVALASEAWPSNDRINSIVSRLVDMALEQTIPEAAEAAAILKNAFPDAALSTKQLNTLETYLDQLETAKSLDCAQFRCLAPLVALFYPQGASRLMTYVARTLATATQFDFSPGIFPKKFTIQAELEKQVFAKLGWEINIGFQKYAAKLLCVFAQNSTTPINTLIDNWLRKFSNATTTAYAPISGEEENTAREQVGALAVILQELIALPTVSAELRIRVILEVLTAHVIVPNLLIHIIAPLLTEQLQLPRPPSLEVVTDEKAIKQFSVNKKFYPLLIKLRLFLPPPDPDPETLYDISKIIGVLQDAAAVIPPAFQQQIVDLIIALTDGMSAALPVVLHATNLDHDQRCFLIYKTITDSILDKDKVGLSDIIKFLNSFLENREIADEKALQATARANLEDGEIGNMPNGVAQIVMDFLPRPRIG